MAQAKDGIVTWIHADHLSSATRITDAAGLEIRRLAYTSFGEDAENQGTGDDPKYKYTGKEADATGLYYYGARYYDPALSRFITADTVYDVGPQGLNRYSYALNNPILYRDPTGHFITGPNDDPNPTAYGNVTGSQKQIADGTATVHDGGDGTFTMPLHVYDEVGHAVFPIDLQEFFSPSPRGGWWKNVKQETKRFQRELAAKQYMINRTDAILTLQLFGESPRRDPEYYHLLKEEMECIEKADKIAYAVSGVVIAGANVVNTVAAPTSGPRTWNEFQEATKGQFSSREEAAGAWEAYKAQQGIVTGTTRSSYQKSKFLKQMANSGKAPKWMNQWLREGKVPPGYEVDHITPLSIGGEDIPSNMRLVDKAFHDMHHSPGFHRPWE